MTLDEYLNSLSHLVFFQTAETRGSLLYNIDWYSKRHPRYRIAYRVAGVLALTLGLLIPLGVGLGNDLLVLLSGGSAFVIALATFYSWKNAWSGYYLAQYNLEVLRDIYDESIGRAKLLAAANEDEALEIAVGATQAYMQGAADAINDETKGYFQSTRLPTLISGK